MTYAVIIRAIWERGDNQVEALAELHRRGLWLTTEQRRQARLAIAGDTMRARVLASIRASFRARWARELAAARKYEGRLP